MNNNNIPLGIAHLLIGAIFLYLATDSRPKFGDELLLILGIGQTLLGILYFIPDKHKV